ncbi:MAG: ABC transporter substrate-binding protein [Methanomassiliicoccales archaeon]
MERTGILLAFAVVALIVMAGIFGAVSISSQHDDRFKVKVEIVEPEENAMIAGVITVKATFESNSPAILAVLKIDDKIIGVSHEAPFHWEIDTTDYLDGEHAIMVMIRNEKGRIGVANSDIIINNGGTNVIIRSPTDGSSISADFEVVVDAVSPRGLAYVRLDLDGQPVGNLTAAPFTFRLDSRTMDNGEHSLMAVACDELGVTASASTTIWVSNPFSIIDERGKLIHFEGVPQRILSMGSSFTEVLYAIGADDLIVGVDSSSKYPAQVSQKINVGSFFTINIEAILATNPDCIITWSFATTSVATLESYGLKVVCYNPGSVSQVMDVIQSLGELTGHKNDAKALIDNMNSRLEAVKARVASVPVDQRPTVYFELRSTKSVGPGTIANELITLAGGRNIYSTSTVKYPLFNSEYIINANPDVIIIEDQSTKTTEQIKSTAGWSEITAVKQDRILRINGELVSSTPRLVDAVEQMAEFFFPR